MNGKAKSRARQLLESALLAMALLLALLLAGLTGTSVAGPERTRDLAWDLAAVVVEPIYDFFTPRRGCGLELNAVGTMRSYCSSQIMYKRMDWDNDSVLEYAEDPVRLRSELDAGEEICLMDAPFADAQGLDGTPKHGYIFKEMKTIAGKPIDWSQDFALCAIPYRYGRTGYRTFIVATNGTIFGKDIVDGAFVDDYPADPAAAGWIIAE